MKKSEIKVGGKYLAKVSGKITTVRVDAIREVECPSSSRYRHRTAVSVYDVTNLSTGRRTTFRSAAKFRGEAKDRAVRAARIEEQPSVVNEGADESNEVEEEDKVVRCDPIDAETILHPEVVADRLLLEERKEGQAVERSKEEEVTVATPTSLASKIAEARRVPERSPDRTVAGMVPNDEQEAILAAAIQDGLRALVIGAGAGTGKTATLRMLEQTLSGMGQYTAFNTALVNESKGKFKKAACNTTHSLAFRAIGKLYQHRLGGERIRSSQVARILGIEDMTITLDEGEQGQNGLEEHREPRRKHLSAEFLAGQVLAAIRRFCQSADSKIGSEHLRYIDGIDLPVDLGNGEKARGRDNNDLVRDYLVPFCTKAWEDMAKIDGMLPFSHDCYVKIWQLGEGDNRPIIPADYILLDEAQDTAPVFLDVIRRQRHALLIMVGDDNQQIYEWRGAVNAMSTFHDAPRRLLSQSYRFGQAIADVANAILATLEQPTDLVMRGNPAVPSRVDQVPSPRCYLYRTNAGAVGRVMQEISDGRKPHLIGGGADTVAWCRAALDLQARVATRHPELCCFETWQEVQEYSKTDEGSDLRLMVKLIDDFGAREIHDALKDMPSEEDADVVISTAHKSKGREWDTVRLGPDFPTANRMNDADRRLLYVAATRARLTLDTSSCPPFCGGEDRVWTVDGPKVEWIPGIKVTYTQEMPSKEQQEARSRPAESSRTTTQPADRPFEPGVCNEGEFTWTSINGQWCVRGPINGAAPGDRVKVVRRNGSVSVVTVLSITRRFSNAWIYAV